MDRLDWLVLIGYLALMVGLSVVLGRGQESQEDYYVGGRDLPWWAVGISTMATQSSAISFISVPAFVALRPGGGLRWLQYELAVPLAMVGVMVLLIPLFRKLELISVYEYLELRYGPRTRSFLAAVFLLSRGLGTGVGVYASAIVLAVFLDLKLSQMILLIGLVTLVYDTIGGMKAVVFSDVIQMVVLVLGIAVAVSYALDEVGGWSSALKALEPARLQALDFRTGLGDGADFPFWGFMIGGLFLYSSYYGCDQSQTQRELSAPTLAHTKYSLVFNGFARLPLTLGYVVLGIATGAVFATSPEARALLPEGKVDFLVPTFVLHYLPHGIKALIFSAILAAAMSSLDSALNSLSASTMRDFVERYLLRPGQSARVLMWWGKGTTVLWGLLVIAFAFLLGGEDTVIERINKVNSAFYGPILAAFCVGVLSRRVGAVGMVSGIVAGVAANLSLWWGEDLLLRMFGLQPVFWMWWNLFGFLVTVVVALGVNQAVAEPPRAVEGLTLRGSGLLQLERRWLPTYGLLFAYFVVMLTLCYYAPALLG